MKTNFNVLDLFKYLDYFYSFAGSVNYSMGK